MNLTNDFLLPIIQILSVEPHTLDVVSRLSDIGGQSLMIAARERF